MASSQLSASSPSSSDSPSGSGQGMAFPFAWRGPVVPGTDTVIKPPHAQGPVAALDAAADNLSDQSRRLFPTVADSDEVAGVRIGHFTIQRRIGIGGMGSVFLATDEQLRRNIALKILAPALSVDASSVQRFQNEARAAARLDHDNIARVFFYGEDAGLHYIAYEYIAGSNLRDVIRQKGRLEPSEAVNYTMQLAAALSHTMAAGVVHRDIKPSNILITPQRRAKLVDLGLARRESHDASAELTVVGTTLGTFDYISPEQAKDPRNVDVRSDIYSLGCTLYHMLTGEPPYPEGTVLQKLLDHQGKDAPDPARKNRRVSPALSAVVRRMMASDPSRRYANPGELLRDLLIVARSLGSGAVPIDGQVWLTATRFQPPVWQRNIGWVATAAALVLLVFAIDRYPLLSQRFDARIRSTRTMDAVPDAPVVEPSPSEQVASASGVANGAATQPGRKTNSPSPAVFGTKETPGESVVGVTQGPPYSEDPDQGEPIITSLRQIPLDPKLADGMFDTKDLPLLSGAVDRRRTSVEAPVGPKPNTTVSVPPTSVPTKEDLPSAAIARPVASVIEATRPPAVTAESNRVVSVLDGKTYGSLEAACAEAKDGSIIELRYNGSRGETERPIRLSNKKNIIVRSGIGFRPVIAFAPTEPPTDATQSRMITVGGGSLELVNVDLTLAIPERIVADRWALFSLERPEKLQLHGVTITVANPSAQPACVIEQVAAAGQGLGNVGMMKNGMPAEPPKVSISESLVRGECDLIVLRDAVPVRFQIKDVLVTLQGTLFHALCQNELANNESDRVTLELDHATCCLSEGLIVTEGIDNLTDRTPPMLVIARNNILSCGPQRPLIVMKDAGDLMDVQRLFIWNGDRNYYDAVGVFWQLGGRQTATTARQLDFDAWRNYWGGNEGTGSTNAAVVWRTKPSDRPWTKMTADAVELNTMATSNPAVNGASDGTNAGVTLSKLPAPADRTVAPDVSPDVDQ